MGLLAAFALRGHGEEPKGGVSNQDEPGAIVGARPYELDWAQRSAPAHRQQVDFEDLSGWRLRCFEGAEAKAYRSRQERLFGDYTAKVVYTGASEQSGFVLEPPKPIAIPTPINAADLWVRGNNWGWMNPPRTARTEISMLLCDETGAAYRLRMGVNNFDYWFLFHAPLATPDGKPRFCDSTGQPSAKAPGQHLFFAGLEVRGCSNREPARLYFDALSFYQMKSAPLTFRGLPKTFAWPTTPDTILPALKAGSGPRPSFTYIPADGTLGDLYVAIDGQTFQPCFERRHSFSGQRTAPAGR